MSGADRHRTLRSSAGDLESVLAIVRDVTQRKADALALRQAQRLESLGILAGGAAHDFNNLLVGVIANAEIALERLDEKSPVRTELDDILAASTRAAELTRELLAYSGTATLEMASVDLTAIVEESAHLVEPTLGRGISVVVDYEPEPFWVHADATQIRQVMMNIIGNAADSMQRAGGRVFVRIDVAELDRHALEQCIVSGAESAGSFCRVAVTDTGVGMDAATLGKVFDPFFTTKFQGRGLGLASTLGIVRSHGGAIRVESAPGRGSRFDVLLPRAETEPAAHAEPQTEMRSGSGVVLIVDDEHLVRKAARRMLESRGYRVLEANSGAGAIEIIEGGEHVDVTLLDLTMPGMDGEQTFTALRSLDASLPVVFMSGHSVEDVALHVANREHTNYISKPFRLRTLCAAIAELLEESDSGGG